MGDQIVPVEQVLIPLGSGLLGIAVGYGTILTQVRVNTRELARLRDSLANLKGNSTGEPAYVRRDECATMHDAIGQQLREHKTHLQAQEKSLKGVQNFARWWLSRKEELSLAEVNEIIDGK